MPSSTAATVTTAFGAVFTADGSSRLGRIWSGAVIWRRQVVRRPVHRQRHGAEGAAGRARLEIPHRAAPASP